MSQIQIDVIAGVDTHADTHTAAVIDTAGRLLRHRQFTADPAGYRQLLSWVKDHGHLLKVGVEGTGSYGAGLARFLTGRQIPVLEVNRPDRSTRRRVGKSDPLDAEAAARAVLAGTAAGSPKAGNGPVEAIRAIRNARRSAIKARTAALNALLASVTTAPAPLRAKLAGLKGDKLVAAAANLRPNTDLADPTTATKIAMRRLGIRCRHLSDEIAQADQDLHSLTAATAPDLLAQFGVGPQTAAQLLITAGDNPDRLHNEASFAALCGTSPIRASSGKTNRHRLNRGGDRSANHALHTIVMVRMRHHQPTRDYVARRRTEGLGTKEIMRCLKRYVARELLPHIKKATAPNQPHQHTATAA
ncbi:MAG: IS110 family transposase [Nocardioidaceae bacterium]